MSIKNVENLLTKGGADKEFRKKYDAAPSKEVFIKLAAEEGFEFTEKELMDVLNESGDVFDSFGNPPKRSIWWK
jgi:predicted ribosomally synthesized peptide with nif11-like leader